MKAIQIKYCGPTNTKGARWKVWAMNNKAKYYARNHALDCDIDAIECAGRYAMLQGWNHSQALGTLPNGDYVAVFYK